MARLEESGNRLLLICTESEKKKLSVVTVPDAVMTAIDFLAGCLGDLPLAKVRPGDVKLLAIKHIRQALGFGLAESKAVVEMAFEKTRAKAEPEEIPF